MHNLLKNMCMERLGKPLESWLRRDRQFVESRERYHRLRWYNKVVTPTLE